jgi:hypothetical protein
MHLYATPTSRQPVAVRNGLAMYSGTQYKEYMLCEPCEARFAGWEDYVARICLQEDDRFPALEAVVPIGPRSGDASALDCAVIARFAASVIWRASASAQFPEVRLGPYASEIVEYLKDDTARLPERSRLLVELFHMKGYPPEIRSVTDHAVVAPGSWRWRGHRDHRFAWFGMWFSLSVGGELPPYLNSMCIERSSRVVLGDGTRHLEAMRELLEKTRPRGKLADLRR